MKTFLTLIFVIAFGFCVLYFDGFGKAKAFLNPPTTHVIKKGVYSYRNVSGEVSVPGTHEIKIIDPETKEEQVRYFNRDSNGRIFRDVKKGETGWAEWDYNHWGVSNLRIHLAPSAL